MIDEGYFKSSDDEQDKFDTKWEIIYFFEKYYLIDQKQIDATYEKIGMKKTFNTKAEKLYTIIKRDSDGPKDIAHFLIELQLEFPKNIPREGVEDIYDYVNDKKYTTQQWVKFFKEKFPKILSNDEYFPNSFKTIFSIAFRKLNNFGGMNDIADKIGEFTDKLADKLNFEDNNNNNSSDSQNVLSGVDPFSPNLDLSVYNNQQIEINEDDQIDVDDDKNDDDTGSQTPTLKSYEEKNNVPFLTTIQPPVEENNKSNVVDDLYNFINTTTNTSSSLPPIYSTPSPLGPVPPLPPIYSTSNSNTLPPFPPAQSAIYSIPSTFNLPPSPSLSNVSSKQLNLNDIYSLTSTEGVDINEFEVNDDEEDEGKNKVISGAEYLTKEVAWSLTNLNREYRMKKISLNSIAKQRELLKRQYPNFELQHQEYTSMLFNRLDTEQLWMRPIYIDFANYPMNKYPQVWTKNIGMKIDNLYKKNKRRPTFFKKC
jgi:hypothetical protein